MSYRQYITTTEINRITGVTVTASTADINLAEEIIDQNVATHVHPSYLAKFYYNPYYGDQGTFTDTTLTLDTTETIETDYFKYTVIEVEGFDLIPVTSSSSKVLSFDTVTGLAGTHDFTIYQLGKFPRFGECEFIGSSSDKVRKRIPFDIKQAVAYQVQFIVENPNLFNGTHSVDDLKSEAIGAMGNHSYTKGDVKGQNGNADVQLAKITDPRAYALLSKYKPQLLQ